MSEAPTLRCYRCGENNFVGSARCWVCSAVKPAELPMRAGLASVEKTAQEPSRLTIPALRAAIVCSVILVVVIGAQLFLGFPGLVIPFTLAALPILAAMLGTLKRSKTLEVDADSTPLSRGARLFGFFAAYAAIVGTTLLMACALMVVASVCLFVLVCFGAIAIA